MAPRPRGGPQTALTAFLAREAVTVPTRRSAAAVRHLWARRPAPPSTHRWWGAPAPRRHPRATRSATPTPVAACPLTAPALFLPSGPARGRPPPSSRLQRPVRAVLCGHGQTSAARPPPTHHSHHRIRRYDHHPPRRAHTERHLFSPPLARLARPAPKRGASEGG